MNQNRPAPPTTETAQAERALPTAATLPAPACPRCKGDRITLRGSRLVAVTQRWAGGEPFTHEQAPPQGKWVGLVQGECDECAHRWTMPPGRPLRLPAMPGPDQAYLVVYLAGGVVADREVAVGADLARRKCLAHVGRATSTGDLAPDSGGVFVVGDGAGLEAWALPVLADDGRPAGEDEIALECRFSAPGGGLCGWAGPASDAGWDVCVGEWVCPGCGEVEGLRVVDL